ncbi:MAG: RNA polymerase sigma factor [Vicinamibacterales bacterium]
MTYGVAKGILRDPGLAEDAAQEAFLRAHRRLRDLDEPRRFRAWLRRIGYRGRPRAQRVGLFVLRRPFVVVGKHPSAKVGIHVRRAAFGCFS